MSFRSKFVALTIGLTLATAGSLGSYAYFSKTAIANDNSITLGAWTNPKPVTTDKDKTNETAKSIQKTDKNKVNKKANKPVKAIDSDKDRQAENQQTESKKVTKQDESLNTNKEVKIENKKIDAKRSNNSEENKTIENDAQNDKESK